MLAGRAAKIVGRSTVACAQRSLTVRLSTATAARSLLASSRPWTQPRCYSTDAEPKLKASLSPANSTSSTPSTSGSKSEAHIVQANDKTFDSLVERVDGTVVVDFYAAWCGPCRMIAPSLAKVTRALNLPLVQLDVDDAQDIASKYSVASLPTVAVFHKGARVDQFIGALNEAGIQKFLETAQEKCALLDASTPTDASKDASSA